MNIVNFVQNQDEAIGLINTLSLTLEAIFDTMVVHF